MAAIFITTTQRSSMDALSYQGINATDYYLQLKNILQKELGGEYALLLAEPMHDDGRHMTDWYTEATGTILPFRELSEEEQGRILQKISQFGVEILALAEKLKQDTASSNSNLRGNLLELATHFPDMNSIYLVGGQPVLVSWGFNPGVAGARPQELSRLGQVVPVVAPLAEEKAVDVSPTPVVGTVAVAGAVPVVGVAGGGCLWLILKFLALLLLLYLLLGLLMGPGGCVRPYFSLPGWNTLFNEPPVETVVTPGERISPEQQGALEQGQEQEAWLRAELDAMRLALQQRHNECPTSPGFSGAMAPKPQPVPMEPEIPPAVPETPVSPPQPEQMAIPDNPTSMDFLEGCWIAETGLGNRKTNLPVVVTYCFDENGKGHSTIMESDGGICKGAAVAKLTKKTLSIKTEGEKCPNGARYSPQVVRCSQQNSETLCSGRPASSKKNSWTNVPFMRMTP